MPVAAAKPTATTTVSAGTEVGRARELRQTVREVENRARPPARDCRT